MTCNNIYSFFAAGLAPANKRQLKLNQDTKLLETLLNKLQKKKNSGSNFDQCNATAAVIAAKSELNAAIHNLPPVVGITEVLANSTQNQNTGNVLIQKDTAIIFH